MCCGQLLQQTAERRVFEDSGYYKYHEAFHLLRFANERQILEKAYNEYINIRSAGKMGMNVIQPVTILDGNQYLVQGPADKTGQATSFDNVYNRSCGDETLDEIFEDVSQEYGVNVNLLKAVAQAESGFDVNATSSCVQWE